MSLRHAVLFIAAMCFAVSVPTLAQTNADWDWVNEHFTKTLDELFPIEQPTGTYIAYRSHRDLYTEILEYSFVIGYDPAEKGSGLQPYLTAHVRIADSVSLYNQLMALHRARPSQAVKALQSKLRVRRWDLTEKQCPAVRSTFVQFQQLHFAAPHFDVIVLHPVVHEVHVQAGDGDMRIDMWDQENPLVKWALETRHDLESCANPVH